MEGSGGIRIPFTEHLGVQLLESTRERAVVSLRRRPELLNSWGATHGGVIMTMLDLVMSWAVRGHYGISGGVLTVDMSVGFMKGSFGDKVTAEGRVLHGGKSTAFCEAEARDDAGALLAKAIGTFKLLADREKKGG
ncbi:MAG TPA: PaaI family thioesterase [Burkholderiales bacterium]|nr:PaaI family thioesterase [Burkholderiales bacterium]